MKNIFLSNLMWNYTAKFNALSSYILHKVCTYIKILIDYYYHNSQRITERIIVKYSLF